MTDLSRIDTIRRLIREHGADAALVTFLPDIRWAVGFTGSNGLLVVTPDAAHFVTDGRYTVQAKSEVHEATVHIPGYQLLEHVEREGLLGSARTVLFQSDHLTVAEFDKLRGRFADLVFEPVSGFLQVAVASKSEQEITAIRKAQAVTEEVFDALLPQIGPGVSEQDLAAEIVYQHLRRGASAMSFEPDRCVGVAGCAATRARLEQNAAAGRVRRDRHGLRARWVRFRHDADRRRR